MEHPVLSLFEPLDGTSPDTFARLTLKLDDGRQDRSPIDRAEPEDGFAVHRFDFTIGLDLDAFAGREASLQNLRSVFTQNIAVIQYRDAIAENVRLVHRVRRQDDGELGIVLFELAEHVPDRAPALRIQPRRGLV